MSDKFSKEIKGLSTLSKNEKHDHARKFARECGFGMSAYLMSFNGDILTITKDQYYD